MARMIEAGDWKGFAARKRESRKRGKLRGIGISNYLETPVGIPHERVEVTVKAEGKIELAVGTQSTGQGHETSFAQVMADLLGVHPEDIVFIGGDTAKIPSGSGTHSDRSMRLGGTLMFQASEDVVAQAKAVAAKLLDAAEADIAFTDGLFATPNSNRRLTVYDVAKAMDENPALAAGKPLQSKKTFTGRIPAYPTGCAICEVEIDPDTGAISVPRYGSIDDAGQAINPLILHGQVHGGIVQGIGQALVEDVRYDDNGQVLTGSFMDYAIPRAHLVPSFDIALTEDPTKGNPLRVKGGGEAGITPALAVVMNAIMDALKDLGVEHMDMPATPARIWAAIQAAKDAEANNSTQGCKLRMSNEHGTKHNLQQDAGISGHAGKRQTSGGDHRDTEPFDVQRYGGNSGLVQRAHRQKSGRELALLILAIPYQSADGRNIRVGHNDLRQSELGTYRGRLAASTKIADDVMIGPNMSAIAHGWPSP